MRDLASLEPHDAYIMEVEQEPLVGALRLRLRCGDLQVGYSDAVLSFDDVTTRPAHLAGLVEVKHPADFEILYDEIDRVDDNRFEYRFLLHPVGEVAFCFSGVRVFRTAVLDRQAE